MYNLVFKQLGFSFAATAALLLVLIWLYTFKGGIKTLVWTDALQTLVLTGATLGIILELMKWLGTNVPETIHLIQASPYNRWVEWNDWHSKQHFLKQFLSGIFITLSMTGLDQDMIQKNLTIQRLPDAQRNMRLYGFAFIPLNGLFLTLGALLWLVATSQQVPLPASSDELLPLMATKGYLSSTVSLLFTVGMVAAAFLSADSALTSLTTSFCIDLAEKPNDTSFRRFVHIGFLLISIVLIVLFRLLNHPSLIDTIYTIVSYTYGPLLGLFAFGLFTRRKARDRDIPLIALASPILCFLIQLASTRWLHYSFGYELLMLNGMLTFTGLFISSVHANRKETDRDSRNKPTKDHTLSPSN